MEKEGLIVSDSDVLIKLTDRNNKQLFEISSRLGFHNFCINSISFSELLCGAHNRHHRKKLIQELGKFIFLELNPTIDKIHRELILKYSLSHGLKVQDSLIAATALFYQMLLFTLSISNYRFITGTGLEVIK